jgi:hypothetical protein
LFRGGDGVDSRCGLHGGEVKVNQCCGESWRGQLLQKFGDLVGGNTTVLDQVLHIVCRGGFERRSHVSEHLWSMLRDHAVRDRAMAVRATRVGACAVAVHGRRVLSRWHDVLKLRRQMGERKIRREVDYRPARERRWERCSSRRCRQTSDHPQVLRFGGSEQVLGCPLPEIDRCRRLPRIRCGSCRRAWRDPLTSWQEFRDMLDEEMQTR